MTISRSTFPDDDDGEVLYQLARKGVDLTKKREVQFYCYVRDADEARRVADDLESYGYQSSVFFDDGTEGTGSVSVYSAIDMVPRYELVVLEQERLNLLLQAYGTKCDGWMTAS